MIVLPRTTLELADTLRLSIGRLARRLRQQSLGGLTPSQRSVLASVNRLGPMTMSRLADVEGVARPSITGITTRLVERGLVERVPDTEDARCSVARLTDHGRDVIRQGQEERNALLVRRLERLDQQERDLLAACVPLLTRLLEEDE